MNSTFEKELSENGRLVYCNVGDSMLPLIRQDKDLLVIEKPKKRIKKYDVILYKRENGQYVLHRILAVKNGGYVLCGDNRYYREYGVQPSQILGVLTSVIREGNEIPVDKFGYKLYSHLWCDFFYIRAGVLYFKNAFLKIKRNFIYASKNK